jgi:hypothetical protein
VLAVARRPCWRRAWSWRTRSWSEANPVTRSSRQPASASAVWGHIIKLVLCQCVWQSQFSSRSRDVPFESSFKTGPSIFARIRIRICFFFGILQFEDEATSTGFANTTPLATGTQCSAAQCAERSVSAGFGATRYTDIPQSLVCLCGRDI